MLPVDLPTRGAFMTLARERSDACVSIYLETTPMTQDADASRIALGNMVRDAIGQLEAAGLDKRRVWPVREQFDDLIADSDFWAHQAVQPLRAGDARPYHHLSSRQSLGADGAGL